MQTEKESKRHGTSSNGVLTSAPLKPEHIPPGTFPPRCSRRSFALTPPAVSAGRRPAPVQGFDPPALVLLNSEEFKTVKAEKDQHKNPSFVGVKGIGPDLRSRHECPSASGDII